MSRPRALSTVTTPRVASDNGVFSTNRVFHTRSACSDDIHTPELLCCDFPGAEGLDDQIVISQQFVYTEQTHLTELRGKEVGMNINNRGRFHDLRHFPVSVGRHLAMAPRSTGFSIIVIPYLANRKLKKNVGWPTPIVGIGPAIIRDCGRPARPQRILVIRI